MLKPAVIMDGGISWCDCSAVDPKEVIANPPSWFHGPCKSWFRLGLTDIVMFRVGDTARPRDRQVGKCQHIHVVRHAWPDGTYEDRCNVCKVILVARNAPRPAPIPVIPILKKWDEMVAARILQEREFDGFCTPCGGLRRHKLGCPTKRAK